MLTSVFVHTTIALLASSLAYAKHSECKWKGPGGATPMASGLTKFCKAEISPVDRAYRCIDGDRYVGLKVADWSVIAPNKIECGTLRDSEVQL